MFRRSILIVLIALAAESQSPGSPPVAQTTFRISGTVVDAVRGDALPDVDVSIALSQAETLLKTETTGPDGRFEFHGLAAKKYELTARGRGYLQQGYEQHHAFFTAIVTGPGLVSEDLIFKLKPESAISGTVTDEFNDPVESAEVLLFITDPTENPPGIALRRKDTTSDSGDFSFGHLQAGSYYLAVVAKPWYARNEEDQDDKEGAPSEVSSSVEETRPAAISEKYHHAQLDVAFQTTYYPNVTDPDMATPIALKPGQQATVDFRLFTVPALRLKIRGSPISENAVSSVKLSEHIFSYSRQVGSQVIGLDGAELNGLAPGHYLAEYAKQPAGQPLQQQLDLGADVEISPGESSKIASTVEGTVLLGGKEPCLRCTIRLINIPSWKMFDAQNSDKGFRIEGGVPPGRYFVFVLKQEGYLIRDITAVGGHVVGTDLEIPAHANVRLAVAMTKDVATIDGVAVRDGKPASQAAVFLVPDDPARKRMLFRRDQSDSDGTFALRAVLPGDYRVVALAEGWDLEWTNPAVLSSYLAGGTKVRVEGTSNYHVQVTEQPLGGASK